MSGRWCLLLTVPPFRNFSHGPRDTAHCRATADGQYREMLREGSTRSPYAFGGTAMQHLPIHLLGTMCQQKQGWEEKPTSPSPPMIHMWFGAAASSSFPFHRGSSQSRRALKHLPVHEELRGRCSSEGKKQIIKVRGGNVFPLCSP